MQRSAYRVHADYDESRLSPQWSGSAQTRFVFRVPGGRQTQPRGQKHNAMHYYSPPLTDSSTVTHHSCKKLRPECYDTYSQKVNEVLSVNLSHCSHHVYGGHTFIIINVLKDEKDIIDFITGCPLIKYWFLVNLSLLKILRYRFFFYDTRQFNLNDLKERQFLLTFFRTIVFTLDYTKLSKYIYIFLAFFFSQFAVTFCSFSGPQDNSW